MKDRHKKTYPGALQMNDWQTDHSSKLTSSIEAASQALNSNKSLDRNQALKLLIDCRTLALRLAGQGMDIALSSWQYQVTLKGFEAVWLAGWLNDPDLQKEAELTPAHIATLGYLLAQQQSYNKLQK
jgi:hypothetical protein